MSSRKRSRTVEDDDNISVNVESASSRFRAGPSKRSRTALAAEHGGNTFSDEDDDDDISTLGSLGPDGTQTRFSSVVPDSIEYNSDEDDLPENEELAARLMRKQFQENRENVPQQNGIIEEVVCTNFMCHQKLRITLGPLINFICGHNGSGKSAVLTALTICLGSKASSTNRGANIRDMIKEGQDHAILQVKIKNQGEGAYRPEQYGRSIIVERHISRTTAPTFKLKSADGKVVSTKKRDLDDMLDFFCLQLDNPINVLNQDMARQFLANSSAADKYKFYIKGTLLETLDNDYRLIEAQIDLTASKLNGMNDDLALLRAAADEAGKRRRQIKQSDSIRVKVRETQRMHAWAQVEEQERVLQDNIEAVAKAEDRVREAEDAAENASGVYEGRNQAFEQSRRFMDDMQQELEPLQSELNASKEEFDQGRTKLVELQSSIRDAKLDYRKTQDRRRAVQQSIDEESRILAEAEGTGHIDRQNRLQEVEEKADQAKEDRKALEDQRTGLETQTQQAQQAVSGIRARLEESKRSQEQAQVTLEQLQHAQGSQYAAYPRDTERLVQEIERFQGWRRKPVGPLGKFIQLKPQHRHWSGLVERTLGGLLNGFVVSCREDQIELRKIQDRLRYNGTTYITTTAHLSMDGKEPAADIDTLLRVLDISDELVKNLLIIQASADQVALIEDRQRAHDTMYHGQRPVNIKAALTFTQGRNRGEGKGVRFGFSRSGMPRSSPISPWQGASRMSVSHADQIQRQRRIIDDAAQAYEGVLQEQRRLQQAFETAKVALNNHKKRRHEAMTKEQALSDEADALREEIEQNRPQDGRLHELQQQLVAVTDEEASGRDVIEDFSTTKGTIDAEQSEIKQRMDEAADKVRQHEEQLDMAREKFHDAEDKRNAALREKNRSIEHVKDYIEEVDRAKAERDTQERFLQDAFITEAEKICPRIPVEAGATAQMLDARLDRFKQDLERAAEEAGGSLEELTAAYVEARKKSDNAERHCNELRHFIKVATASWNSRIKRWKMFRRWIGLRAKTTFQYLLSIRGFRGAIAIDHVSKLLDLSVEPNIMNASDGGREARTLSGGEKSFATICMLLSIWEAIASPIRCLDEFDVFMDSVNRGESVRMITENARRSVGRQFILITPQSMSNIDEKDDVSIYKMQDPERGQQTLSFV